MDGAFAKRAPSGWDEITRTSRPRESRSALGSTFGNVAGLTATEVRGFGGQKEHVEPGPSAEFVVDFRPHVKVEAVVPDSLVTKVVAVIERATKTGRMDDGKVFVAPARGNGERTLFRGARSGTPTRGRTIKQALSRACHIRVPGFRPRACRPPPRRRGPRWGIASAAALDPGSSRHLPATPRGLAYWPSADRVSP
jgi:nitrogen regulatory protein P-II 1